MRFRPRYSLLTLLVLTALVAGAVKLWYGPHHVVERIKPDIEVEYNFTRDWRESKQIQGPYIAREFKTSADGPWCVSVYYYRQGIPQNWKYTYMDDTSNNFTADPVAEFVTCPLTVDENAEFMAAVSREKNNPIAPGKKRFEGMRGEY